MVEVQIGEVGMDQIIKLCKPGEQIWILFSVRRKATGRSHIVSEVVFKGIQVQTRKKIYSLSIYIHIY